jgi:hypothetical protein
MKYVHEWFQHITPNLCTRILSRCACTSAGALQAYLGVPFLVDFPTAQFEFDPVILPLLREIIQ